MYRMFRVGPGDTDKTVITITCFMSVDMDNYHDKCQIIISISIDNKRHKIRHKTDTKIQKMDTKDNKRHKITKKGQKMDTKEEIQDTKRQNKTQNGH